MSEQENYKNKILTELFNSKKIHKKVEGIVGRHVSKDTFIFEDVLQDTFFHLAKYPAEKLIEAYEDDPNRLVALGVTITTRRGVSTLQTRPDYPNCSVLKNILFASNFITSQYIQETDSTSDEDIEENQIILLDNDTLETNEQAIWQLIHDNLSPDEISILNAHLNKGKKVGKQTQNEIDVYSNLLQRIRKILEHHNYKIQTNE